MADQSVMSRIAATLLPVASKRIFPTAWIDAGDDRDQLGVVAKKRRATDGPRPDLLLQRSWGRATTQVSGRDLHLLTPKSGSTGRVLFYCHGGAFVVGPSSLEWLFVARLAMAIGCDFAIYDYPKVPEVDSTTIRETTMAAYDVIAERYGADEMLIGGTSAGGGLAVSTMVQLHRAGRQLPSAAVLVSPWLDMTVSHPDVDTYLESDRLLPADLLRRDGELYAGPADVTDPLVSPRFLSASELAAFPPVVVTAGEDEILLPEAREFVDNAEAAGVASRLVLEPHGQHGGVLASTREGKAAIADCVEFLRSHRNRER